jgi:hypothetical protein
VSAGIESCVSCNGDAPQDRSIAGEGDGAAASHGGEQGSLRAVGHDAVGPGGDGQQKQQSKYAA